MEDILSAWLNDPPWVRVFKHTFDVVSDYVSYGLATVGAIAMSVRLLTTLSSGDLVCILIGVENGTRNDLGPYFVDGGDGMLTYAQTEQGCVG